MLVKLLYSRCTKLREKFFEIRQYLGVTKNHFVSKTVFFVTLCATSFMIV